MPCFIHFENLLCVFDRFNWNIYSNTTWNYHQESFGWFLALRPWWVSIVASINDKLLMSGRSRIIGMQLPQMQSWQYVTAELELESFILIVIQKCIELPQWVWITSSHPSVLNVFSENIFCLGVPPEHFLQYIQTQYFYIWYFLQHSCCTHYTSMFSYSTEAALDQYFHPFFPSPFQLLFIWSFPLSRHHHLDGASNLYSHQQWRHANTSWDQMQYKHIPSIHWTAATSSSLQPPSLLRFQ